MNFEIRNQDFSRQSEIIQKLIFKVEAMLVEEPPINLQKGGGIQKGYSTELDELIKVTEQGQQMLAELEADEKNKTGINNLKIKFNNVFGYFIEVTHAHKSKVPDRYTRKQTLTNAERYITTELNQLEEKILTGKSKRIELEQSLFNQVKQEILSLEQEILFLSDLWSELDVYSALAWLAVEQNYVMPSFSKDKTLDIKGSRHPVIEQEQKTTFVANDIYMSSGDCFLITGPNLSLIHI